MDFTIRYDSKNLLYDVRRIVIANHYSESFRSLKPIHVFALICPKRGTIGTAIFGQPMSKHFRLNILELRRFCIIDDTPRNTESFFLGHCLRWIRKNDTSYVQVVTFADPNHGHVGTIYKATNFKYDGEEKSKNPRIVKHKSKNIHMRQYYQKKQGEYTNNALKLQNLVKIGKARIVNQKRKLRYIYQLQKVA